MAKLMVLFIEYFPAVALFALVLKINYFDDSKPLISRK